MSSPDVPSPSETAAVEQADAALEEDRSGVLAAAAGVVQAVAGTLAKGGQASAAAVSRSTEGAATTLTKRVIRNAAGSAARPEEHRRADPGPCDQALRDDAGRSHRSHGGSGGLEGQRAPLLDQAHPHVDAGHGDPRPVVCRGAGTNELSALASYLTVRAESEGVEPDPARLETTVVQLALGQPVDPDADIRHGPLVLRWLGTGAWGIVAMGNRGRSDPRRLAAAASAVPVSILGGGQEPVAELPG